MPHYFSTKQPEGRKCNPPKLGSPSCSWSTLSAKGLSFTLIICEGIDMPQGKIKKVITDKGFGFIQADGGDLFFHHSELKNVSIEELREGQMVEYTVGQ